MMRSLSQKLLLLTALCLAIGLVTMPVEAGKTKVEICDNGRDDDRDGYVDCDDDDCSQSPACGGGCVPTEETCGDRVDNDCDGVTDCADGDCAGDAACGEEPRCRNSYRAVFESLPGDSVLNDDSDSGGAPVPYVDGVDKVEIFSGPNALRFNTGVSKKLKAGIRHSRLDLSQFPILCTPADPGVPCAMNWKDGPVPGQSAGLITTSFFFQIAGAGLNLCEMALGASATVPVYFNYGVTDAIGDSVNLSYGLVVGYGQETPDGEWWCGQESGIDDPSSPAVVTRTGEKEWTIEGTDACLYQGQGSWINQSDTGFSADYARDARFKLTVTEIP